MNLLLAGGAGDVGKHLCDHFCLEGHQVVIIDKNQFVPGIFAKDRVKFYLDDLTDSDSLKKIVVDHAINVIVDLAWSFADDPRTLFANDIVGQINLMEAAAVGKVERFIYTSTAGVYGIPSSQEIEEGQICRPEEARKPLYSVAKLTAEQLCLAWGRQYNLPVTVLRFWWAFGDTIGGKHLRQLVKNALQGEPIRLVAGAGGDFVSMSDLAVAVELTASKEPATGQTYNIAGMFLTWQEISAMIIELTRSKSRIILIEPSEWNGPAFLSETWHLSWKKAAHELGYHPSLNSAEARDSFRWALSHCIAQVRGQLQS